MQASTCECRSSEHDADGCQVQSDHDSNHLPPTEAARQMEELDLQKPESDQAGDRANWHPNRHEEAVHSSQLAAGAGRHCIQSVQARKQYPGFHPASIAEAMRWFIQYEAALEEDSGLWMSGQWFSVCPQHVQRICNTAHAGALTVRCGQSTEAASWAMRAATTCGISAYFTVTPSGQCEIDLVRSSRVGAPALRAHAARDEEGNLRQSAATALNALVMAAQRAIASGVALHAAVMPTAREAREGACAAGPAAMAPCATAKQRRGELQAAVLRSVRNTGKVEKKKNNKFKHAKNMHAAAGTRNAKHAHRQNIGPGGEAASVWRASNHRAGNAVHGEFAATPTFPDRNMRHVAGNYGNYGVPSRLTHAHHTQPVACSHPGDHTRWNKQQGMDHSTVWRSGGFIQEEWENGDKLPHVHQATGAGAAATGAHLDETGEAHIGASADVHRPVMAVERRLGAHSSQVGQAALVCSLCPNSCSAPLYFRVCCYSVLLPCCSEQCSDCASGWTLSLRARQAMQVQCCGCDVCSKSVAFVCGRLVKSCARMARGT